MGVKIGDYERIDRELVRNCHIFDFYEDTLINPEGKTVKYDHIEHKGAAAVVPVLEDGRILMVRQFRNSLDRYTWEIPAGGRDSVNEDFKVAAARELEEETGYKSDNLKHLIKIATAIAYCSEIIEVYVATNLQKSSQNLDDNEFIDVKAFELEELKQMIYEGKIQDSKTIASIMSYANRCTD